jgi:glycosyltransferase involved in cell wall biosynthesis
MSLLKVTFLTGEYPPMQGGIADHTAYLTQHLAPLGVESSILITRRWEDEEAKKRRGEQAEKFSGEKYNSPSPLPISASAPPRVIAALPNWGWRCWPGVVSFIKTHQSDILHLQYQAAAFNLGGWVNWLPWYLRRTGLPTKIVVTFHDLRPPYIFPKAGSFRWRSMLALAGYSHAVICTNREDLNQLSMANSQWPATRRGGHRWVIVNHTSPTPPLPHSLLSSWKGDTPLLTLIPLGSNVEVTPPADYDRAKWRRQYQANDKTLLLAYFGFLNESKGGEELIEALARLRQQGFDARLLLIGGEVGHADPTNVAYAQKVQGLIEQHQLVQVVYRTGYTALPEVSANLLAADAVVMPYQDGVSFRRTTLIAALRHGCPVVSTFPANPAAIPEIQPGENMLLSPPGDAAALAEAISLLVNDMALRQKLAAGAKQLGHLFEWDQIAQETLALYRWIK